MFDFASRTTSSTKRFGSFAIVSPVFRTLRGGGADRLLDLRGDGPGLVTDDADLVGCGLQGAVDLRRYVEGEGLAGGSGAAGCFPDHVFFSFIRAGEGLILDFGWVRQAGVLRERRGGKRLEVIEPACQLLDLGVDGGGGCGRDLPDEIANAGHHVGKALPEYRADVVPQAGALFPGKAAAADEPGDDPFHVLPGRLETARDGSEGLRDLVGLSGHPHGSGHPGGADPLGHARDRLGGVASRAEQEGDGVGGSGDGDVLGGERPGEDPGGDVVARIGRDDVDAVAVCDASRDVVEGDEASFALLVQLPVPVPDDLPEAVAHRGEKITHRVIRVKRHAPLARCVIRVATGRPAVRRSPSAAAARLGPGLTSAV